MAGIRLLIVNPTCLSLLHAHRPWLSSLGVEVLEGIAGTGNASTDIAARLSMVGGADAIVGPAAGTLRMTPEVAQAAGRLRVISLASSGHEWVNLPSATEHGIVVAHTPLPGLGEVVADLTWGLLLSVARQIPEHHSRLQRGNSERGMGAMVWGRTLGIVGLGNVGQRVALRAAGFAMRVIAAEIRPDMEFCATNDIAIVDLPSLLQQSDFVSLHLRLEARTEGIIGERELGLMKRDAFLINTARAGLVDEQALTRAILEHRIAGAAMDDPPQGAARSLLRLPNVVFTPHIGNRVLESADAVCRQAYTNALDVIQGRILGPRYVLNPEVYHRNPSLARVDQHDVA